MNRRPSLRTITLTLVCLLVPLTMLAGALAAAVYKSTNPDNIDITTSLAYLRQTMTIAIIVFALLTATIAGLIVTMYRRDHNFSQAKLPLILLITVVGTLAVVLVTNAYTDSVQNQYLRDHGRPTLNQFFESLEKQKQ